MQRCGALRPVCHEHAQALTGPHAAQLPSALSSIVRRPRAQNSKDGHAPTVERKLFDGQVMTRSFLKDVDRRPHHLRQALAWASSHMAPKLKQKMRRSIVRKLEGRYTPGGSGATNAGANDDGDGDEDDDQSEV